MRLRFRRGDARREVDDELAFHLEQRARDLVAEGTPPDAARLRAEREFGDVGAIRAACLTIDERRHRRARRAEHMGDVWQDLRFAARTLRKAPAFALTAIVCVALGVGVTTTIFSAVDAILVRPLPYAEPDRLVAVYAQNAARGYTRTNISYLDYLSWRDESRTLDALGIWTWSTFSLSAEGGDAERVEGSRVAASLFPLLGVRPLLGRTLRPDEETAGRDGVVLLGHSLWVRRFGADSSIVGRTITVEATPRVVVGVMPPGFHFPDRGELWTPLVPDPAADLRGSRFHAGAIGRLKPGATFAQAQADLAAVSRRLEREFPNENRDWAAELVPLREDLVGDLERPLLVFFGAVACVLLIACANVANLMLARGAARQRELAVRTAIGAGGRRLARQVLTESLLVAVAGGALGAVLAALGVALLRAAFPQDVPFLHTLAIDWRAAAFVAGVSLLTGVAFGLAPALRAGRVSVAGALRDGARGAGGGEGVERGRLRASLVVAEIALSLVLMIGAGLLIRSYRALEAKDLGFVERGVLTVRVSLPRAKYGEPARRAAFFDALLARVRALPGVRAAGSAQGIPFSGWDVQAAATVEGAPPPRPGTEPVVHFQFVSPGYLAAIGVPLVRGRALAATDRDTAAMVGVVNEAFARDVLGGADPIGRRVRLGSQEPWATIVGVTRDHHHYRLPRAPGPSIYFPFASSPQRTQTLAIRTALADPHAHVPAVRAAVRALDPDVPLYEVQTLEERVGRTLWRQRLQGQVLGLFAALALLLAVVGLYGVISYAVAQRTRELGVRLALGATRGQVLGLVLREGARLAAVGVAIGVAAALALSRVVASLLYDVRARDPLTFVVVPLLLGVAAVLATLAPARRATRVDPLIAMRSE